MGQCPGGNIGDATLPMPGWSFHSTTQHLKTSKIHCYINSSRSIMNNYISHNIFFLVKSQYSALPSKIICSLLTPLVKLIQKSLHNIMYQHCMACLNHARVIKVLAILTSDKYILCYLWVLFVFWLCMMVTPGHEWRLQRTQQVDQVGGLLCLLHIVKCLHVFPGCHRQQGLHHSQHWLTVKVLQQQ